MPYSVSFTREQVISGLMTGNSHKFMYDGPSGKKEMDRESYLGYRRTVENTLDALDAISEKLGPNNAVYLDTLMWQSFSGRAERDVNFFTSHDGSISRIGKSNKTGRRRDTYCIEFYDCIDRDIRPDADSGGLWFRKTHFGDTKVSYTSFTIEDLNYCIEFERFDTESGEFVKDGFSVPEDVTNRKLIMELLAEGNSLGFILPVDLNTLMRTGNRTKYDIVSQRGRLKNIPKSVNRYPLVIGYMMKYALPVIGKEGLPKFQGDNAEKCIRILKENVHVFRRCHTRTLTGMMDRAVAVCLWENIDEHVSVNYLDMCRKNRMTADLSIRNEHTMLDTVARMTPRKMKDRKLKIAEPFRVFESKVRGYELLKTTGEMEIEGIRQHNCVKTYIGAVDAGRCGIFTHVNAKGKRFTIEVGYRDGLYRCHQFKGAFNCDSESDETEFLMQLNRVNTEIKEERESRLHGADGGTSEACMKMAAGAEYSWEQYVHNRFNNWARTTMRNFVPEDEEDVPL